MANVIGEAFVRVRPLVTGFQAEATAATVPAAAVAGEEAGVAAGAGMQKGIASKKSAIGGVIKGVLAAEAVIKAAEFFKSGVEVAAQFQEANRALEVSLKAVGHGATAQLPAIGGFLAKLQETSAFSRLDLTASFTRLVQGTGDVSKAFRLAGIAADVSRGRHMGLLQATQLVARVAAGTGVTSLRRLGITYAGVTTATDKVKASMVELQKKIDGETGSTKKADQAALKQEKSLLASAKAHDKVATAAGALNLVQKRFAGQAEDYASTQQGAIDRVRNTFQLLQKQVGDQLTPVISGAANVIDSFGQSLLQADSPARIITETLGIFGGIVLGIAAALKVAAAAEWLLNQALEANPVVRVVTLLALLVAVLIELYKHNARFRQIVQETWAAIAPIVQSALGAVRGAIASFVAWANAFWAAHGATIVADARAAWAFIVGIVNAGLASIEAFWAAHGARITADARQAWNAIRAVVGPTLAAIRTLIIAFVGAVQAFWGRWGSTLTTIARQAFNLIKVVVQSTLAQVRAVIQAFADLIHGRWQAFGRDLVNILVVTMAGTIRVIRAAIPLALTAAIAIGRAVISGIQSALATLFSVVLAILQQVPHAVEAIVPAVISAAISIGEGIASGIVQGLAGLAGRVGSAISGAVSGAISAAKHAAGIKSPSTVTQHEIGEPLGEGIARGVDAVKHKIRTALTSAVLDAVSQARQSLTQLGSTLEGQVGAMLDAIGSKTTAARHLADINSKAALADFKSQQAALLAVINGGAASTATATIDDARQQLIAGSITGAQFAATSAQAQIDAAASVADARAKLDLLQTQHTVDAEQAATDKKKALVNQQIDDLTDALNRGVINQQQYLTKISGILRGAGVSYKAAGALLGSAFADGFRDTVQAIIAQVKALAPFLKFPNARGSGSPPSVTSPLQQVRTDLAADTKRRTAERTAVARDRLAIRRDEAALRAARGAAKPNAATIRNDEEKLRLDRQKLANDTKTLQANQAQIALLTAILNALKGTPTAADQTLAVLAGIAGGGR